MLSTLIAHDIDSALNENQAAEFLGLSTRTLQAWRVRGGGPRYCKIGRSVRYSRRELIAFQQTHTFTSTTEADAANRGSS
jgi:predicted DNA-binding transcriptional regulator AlpA